jgi:hypothetical protein
MRSTLKSDQYHNYLFAPSREVQLYRLAEAGQCDEDCPRFLRILVHMPTQDCWRHQASVAGYQALAGSMCNI